MAEDGFAQSKGWAWGEEAREGEGKGRGLGGKMEQDGKEEVKGNSKGGGKGHDQGEKEEGKEEEQTVYEAEGGSELSWKREAERLRLPAHPSW
jgi:hypothetical protein